MARRSTMARRRSNIQPHYVAPYSREALMKRRLKTAAAIGVVLFIGAILLILFGVAILAIFAGFVALCLIVYLVEPLERLRSHREEWQYMRLYRKDHERRKKESEKVKWRNQSETEPTIEQKLDKIRRDEERASSASSGGTREAGTCFCGGQRYFNPQASRTWCSNGCHIA